MRKLFVLMQVTYDLEDQRSLAKYLEDADIRLIRAECPTLQIWLISYFSIFLDSQNTIKHGNKYLCVSGDVLISRGTLRA